MVERVAEGTACVVVIDDVEEVARVTASSLESRLGKRCIWFTEPSKLVDHVRAHSVSVIVSDLKMPETSGEVLQERVMEMDPSISFVFVTGHADVPSTVRIMSKGAVTLLEKPINIDRLAAAVEEARLLNRVRRESLVPDEALRGAISSLETEEHQVLQALLQGTPQKTIAKSLCISLRTVDRRRKDILRKCGANSIIEIATRLSRLLNTRPK